MGSRGGTGRSGAAATLSDVRAMGGGGRSGAIHEMTPGERTAAGIPAEVNPASLARDSHGGLKIQPREGFVPRPGGEVNIGAAPNPHDIADLYGEHQLAAALSQYSNRSLREAAA